MNLKKFFALEWETIAGVLAAVAASVLHLLHIVDGEIMLSIVMALIALLFMSFMRHTRHNELMAEQIDRVEDALGDVAGTLAPNEVELIGPLHLRAENERFVREMGGATVWYNLCLAMYRQPHVFDALVRQAIENPRVGSIQFVLDASQRPLWESVMQPRLQSCHGHAKVRAPRWCRLERNVSFILAEQGVSGAAEALLSFWGAPFMAHAAEREVPRFIFRVKNHCELLPHLTELALQSSPGSDPASDTEGDKHVLS